MCTTYDFSCLLDSNNVIVIWKSPHLGKVSHRLQKNHPAVVMRSGKVDFQACNHPLGVKTCQRSAIFIRPAWQGSKISRSFYPSCRPSVLFFKALKSRAYIVSFVPDLFATYVQTRPTRTCQSLLAAQRLIPRIAALP